MAWPSIGWRGTKNTCCSHPYDTPARITWARLLRKTRDVSVVEKLCPDAWPQGMEDVQVEGYRNDLLRPGSFDCVVSNLALHWMNDLPGYVTF